MGAAPHHQSPLAWYGVVWYSAAAVLDLQSMLIFNTIQLIQERQETRTATHAGRGFPTVRWVLACTRFMHARAGKLVRTRTLGKQRGAGSQLNTRQTKGGSCTWQRHQVYVCVCLCACVCVCVCMCVCVCVCAYGLHPSGIVVTIQRQVHGGEHTERPC